MGFKIHQLNSHSILLFIYFFLLLICLKVNSDELNNQTNSNFNNVQNNNSTENTEEEIRKKIEVFRNMVYLYYLPLIVLIGIIGNSITLVILSFEKKLLSIYDVTKSFKANIEASLNINNVVKNIKRHSGGVQFSSSNYFIASLAISDLIYNLILLCLWITRMGFNILNIRYICEISIALSYICSFLSAAFTTMFTFQRFMAVVYPLKSATCVSLQSKFKIKILIFLLMIFSIATYSFSLFMYDAEPKKEHEQSTELQNICSIKNGYTNTVNIIDNSIDTFLTLIIPSFCILIMNIAIIKTVTMNSKNGGFLERIKRKSDFRNKKGKKERNEDLLFIQKENSKEMETLPTLVKNTGPNVPQFQINNDHKTKSNSSSHITKTLLVVSFFFILLNSPYRVSKLFSYINLITKKTEVYSNFDFVLNEVLINLYFTSYSVNFFLYSLCGKKFRASLKALIFPFISFIFKILSRFFKNK